MAGSSLTATLDVKLIDDVSKPARSVAQALRDAEKAAAAVAKGMAGTNATDKFVRSLSGLKLGAKDIDAVAKSWTNYSKSAGLAADSTKWTKTQWNEVRAWERNQISALRNVKREQLAYHKSIAAAVAAGGQLPMTMAMSKSNLQKIANSSASAKMLSGMGAFGMRPPTAAQVAAAAGKSPAGLSLGSKASDFASFALPGTAGMMLGMGGAAAAGAATGGAVAYSMKQAIDFDKAMADVRKKVNLGQGETLADVEAMINKNARAFGIMRTEMAALAAQAGQSGIEFKNLSGFMQTAAKVSSAWDVSAKDAAESLANVRAQTGWTNEALAAYADKVNFLGDVSAAAEKNINGMWGKTSAGAKAAGVSYDDAMVAMTAFSSVGMDTDVSARFFGQLTSRLRTASSQTGAPSALKKLGLDAKTVEKNMQKNGLATVIDFLERLSKSKDAVSIALGVGGKEWFDEILRAVQALKELIRLRDALASGKWSGSLDQSLNSDLQTTANHLERVKAIASEVGDNLSRWALPPINAQIDKFVKSYETAKSTGFLAGSDGLPIDRLKDKTPIPFSPENRARYLAAAGREGGIAAYEARLGLNRRREPAGHYMPANVPLPPRRPAELSPSLKVNNEAALSGIHEADNALNRFSATRATATVDVDTSSAEAKIAALENRLRALGASIKSASAGAAAAGAAARSAAASVSGLGKVQRGNFSFGGVQGE